MGETNRDDVKETCVEEKREAGKSVGTNTPAGCLFTLLGWTAVALFVRSLYLACTDGENVLTHIGGMAVFLVAFVFFGSHIPINPEVAPEEKPDEKAAPEKTNPDADVLPSELVSPEDLRSGFDLTPTGIAKRRGEKTYSGVDTELDMHMQVKSPKKLNKKNKSICPKCGSSDTIVLGSTKKASFTRAIVGGAIAGVPGAMVGSTTGKKMRVEMMCRSCGARWRF